MEQQFEKGDKVRIRFRDHLADDYRFQFTDIMTRLSGRVFTIREVYEDVFDDSYEVEDDNCKYFLAEDPANEFSWSSGMLEYAGEMYDKIYEDESENVENKENIKSKIRKILYSSITEDYDKIPTTDGPTRLSSYPMWFDSEDFHTVTTMSTRR